jgi:hypothetical protein
MESPPTFEPFILSPLDHLMAPINIFFFVIFKLEHPLTGIPVLHEGLSRMLTTLPHVSGNVALSSQAQTRFNVWTVQPADMSIFEQAPMLRLQHHEQGIATMDWGAMPYEQYIPLPNSKKSPEPLAVARFQANIMEDGIVLCMGFNHLVMDLSGAMTVIKSLAAGCRGAAPFNDWVPYKQGRDKLFSAAATCDGVGYLEETDRPQRKTMPETRDPEDHYISHKFTFYDERIEELKRICISMIPKGNMSEPGELLSRDDIVTALVWIGMLRARHANSPLSSKETSLYRGINVRPHLQSLIPSNYIGNAAMCVAYGFPRERLVRPVVHGIEDVILLRDIALILRDGLNAFTSEHVYEKLIRVLRSNDWSNLSFGDADVEVTSWRRFGFYEFDFGSTLGKIDCVEVPDARIKNTAYILPANPTLASLSPDSHKVPPWEVRIVLGAGAMEHLCHEPLFRWASGIHALKPEKTNAGH